MPKGVVKIAMSIFGDTIYIAGTNIKGISTIQILKLADMSWSWFLMIGETAFARKDYGLVAFKKYHKHDPELLIFGRIDPAGN